MNKFNPILSLKLIYHLLHVAPLESVL